MSEDKLLDLEAINKANTGEVSDDELEDVAGGKVDMGRRYAALCGACNQVVSVYYDNPNTTKNAVSLMNALKTSCPKCGARGQYRMVSK